MSNNRVICMVCKQTKTVKVGKFSFQLGDTPAQFVSQLFILVRKSIYFDRERCARPQAEPGGGLGQYSGMNK